MAKKAPKKATKQDLPVSPAATTSVASETRKLTDREKAQNITPEQEAKLADYKARGEELARSTAPIDLEKMVDGVLEAYKTAALPPPKMAIITLSPVHGLHYTTAMKFVDERLPDAVATLQEQLAAYLPQAQEKIAGWSPSADFWDKVNERVKLKLSTVWSDTNEIHARGIDEFYAKNNRQTVIKGMTVVIAPPANEVFSVAVAELGAITGQVVGELYPDVSRRIMQKRVPEILLELQQQPDLPKPRSLAANIEQDV